MWVITALASALFAGATSVLAKMGLEKVDSNLATALRTLVVLAFAWGMALLAGSAGSIGSIDSRSMVFLALSGTATGASWLCYFRALQLGDVTRVVPIDKSGTVLTMLLAFLFLREPFTLAGLAGMALVALGTYLMAVRPGKSAEKGVGPRNPALSRKEERAKGPAWFWYALLSAFFASLTAILGKIGIVGVESNLGTAVRTVVVALFAWGIVLARGSYRQVRFLTRRNWLFLGLSGIATGLSWLCYYRALQEGPVSVVAPIDKLSVVVTIAAARLLFGERLSARSAWGLAGLIAGTGCLLFA